LTTVSSAIFRARGKGRGGDDWAGIVPDDVDQESTFENLNEYAHALLYVDIETNL